MTSRFDRVEAVDVREPGVRVAVSNLLHLLRGLPLVDRFALCGFPTCSCSARCLLFTQGETP